MRLSLRKTLVELPPVFQHGLALLTAAVLIVVTGALVPDASSQLYAVDLCAVVVLSSLFGRSPAFTFLAAISLLLAYFALEGDGFAVSDPIDALGLVAFIFSGIVVANRVDALRRRMTLDAARLAESDARRAFNDSAVTELSHRIGNDLGALAGIAAMKARAAQQDETRAAMESIAHRIQTVGSLYGRLRFARDATVSVEMEPFIGDLCMDMRKAYMNLRPITLSVDVDRTVMLLDRAVLVGLIINELLTNALKYAFPEDRAGTIWIRLSADADTDRPWMLTVVDDGVGFADSIPKGTGFGQKLIRVMASQLQAQFSLSRQDGRTCAELRFASPEPDPDTTLRS